MYIDTKLPYDSSIPDLAERGQNPRSETTTKVEWSNPTDVLFLLAKYAQLHHFPKDYDDLLNNPIDMGTESHTIHVLNWVIEVLKHLADNSLRDSELNFEEKFDTPNSRVILEINERLEELEVVGKEENLIMSQDSKSEFLKFIHLLNPSIRPLIFIVENGNLRALWPHDDGRQIGLQFLGEERIQYVMFDEKQSDGTVNTEYGRTSFKKIIDLINKSPFKDLHTP